MSESSFRSCGGSLVTNELPKFYKLNGSYRGILGKLSQFCERHSHLLVSRAGNRKPHQK